MHSKSRYTHTTISRHMVWHHALVLFLVAAAVVAIGCRDQTETPSPIPMRATSEPDTTAAVITGAETAVPTKETPMPGFQMELGEGSEQPERSASLPLAESSLLPPEDAQALLGRLPDMAEYETDQQAFRLPVSSLPAPRTGDVIEQTFPPEDEAAPVQPPESGPLTVLRYSPEGEVPLAPFLSVTFDQPMVALTGLEDLAQQDVPVTLDPLPEGSWRWVGTKTLMFEPVTRFPMATEYEVTIPAGTTSATGGRLESAFRWSFGTPALTLVTTYPNEGPHRRDSIMFAAFDQQIDPDAVLSTTKVRAGRQSYDIRLATAEDVAGDDQVSRLAKQAGEGRWLAFKATETLPYNTTVLVDIGPGAPSAEGPRKTANTLGFVFQTYGPLQVVETQCGYGNKCAPLTPWTIRFSNPLNTDAFDDALVTVDPELPDMVVEAFGDRLRIRGRSQGRTTYRVTIGRDLEDVYGQTLEESATESFSVGSAER